jgi:hypothetical protein
VIVQRIAIASLAASVLGSGGCAGGAASHAASTASPALPPTPVTRDSAASTLIPPGYGTLKQEDVAIVLTTSNVRITAIPLDESIIRVIAPDSYRALHATLENKRQQITQRASMRGIRDPRVWYVTFTGLTPDARFVPTDITVTSGGRDFRPFDVIALTSGFGEQRLQPNTAQRGLLLFDEALDVTQPITVAAGIERNTDWETILRRIDAERASIRARAGGRP